MIETNLTRIADALEALVHKLDHIGCAVEKIPVLNEQVAPEVIKAAQTPAPAAPTAPAAPAPAAPAPAAPTAPAAPAPAAPAPAAPAPAAPAAPTSMTAEELNAELVKEYQRLKSRDPIIAAMAEMSATAISELKPEQYADLLAKVRAA